MFIRADSSQDKHNQKQDSLEQTSIDKPSLPELLMRQKRDRNSEDFYQATDEMTRILM